MAAAKPDSVAIALFKHAKIDFELKFRMVERLCATWATPGVEHAQIVIDYGLASPGVRNLETWSTNRQMGLCRYNTRYWNDNWLFFEVNMTKAEISRLITWLYNNEHAPYNVAGYYCNYLPFCVTCCAASGNNKSYTCSEMVITSLKHATNSRLFSEITQSHLTTVADIYRIMQSDSEHFVQTWYGPMYTSDKKGPKNLTVNFMRN
jgi:hypothetical protein